MAPVEKQNNLPQIQRFGLRIWVLGLGFGFRALFFLVLCLGFWVLGLGFWVFSLWLLSVTVVVSVETTLKFGKSVPTVTSVTRKIMFFFKYINM